MNDARRRIGDLIVKLQTPFLETWGLELTAGQAADRLHVREATCREILDLLTDAGVLRKTDGGTYVRRVRRPDRHAA